MEGDDKENHLAVQCESREVGYCLHNSESESGTPISFTKNLHVCGGCLLVAAKLISKVAEHEIVVRYALTESIGKPHYQVFLCWSLLGREHEEVSLTI